MIKQPNSGQQVIDQWTLVGGTAMRLQINHRESNGVDIPDAIMELPCYRDDVAKTLVAIEKQNPDFVNGTISQLIIEDPFLSQRRLSKKSLCPTATRSCNRALLYDVVAYRSLALPRRIEPLFQP
jgi:hypothetical protein